VIWDRWRRSAADPEEEIRPAGPFDDLLEDAPLIALLVDSRERVIAANREARRYFTIGATRLPLGLVEFTRGNAVSELLRAGKPDNEARLVHQERIVRSRLVPGPRPGETLVLLTDVTDLRRLETVRQEFVANLSHELKTPLTSLRLAVESLGEGPPEESRRRFAERALKEVDHLAAIVDNLRQLAEIEAAASGSRSTRSRWRLSSGRSASGCASHRG
jgi:two-component system phosphate regulon sensor histidine kinase PhoR